MRNFSKLLCLALSVVLLSSCGKKLKNYKRAVYMLVDISGTYVKEIDQATKIIKLLIRDLNPGDTFTLARIDSNSFSEKDIILNVTFSRRASSAVKQKRTIVRKVIDFSKKAKSSSYTDITGGVLQGVEYLLNNNAARKTLIIFSDLKEDLRKGSVRKGKIDFDGIKVVSINVTKLKSDARDPRKYFKRIKYWRNLVKKGNGEWNMIPASERNKIVSVVLE